MDEDTTIVQDVTETGAQEAQPVPQNDTEATDVQDVVEPSETQQDATETQSAPEVDDKLTKYAQSQGIDLDSPSAIKAARIAMSAQSEATKNYQKAQELEKATNITQEQIPVDATQQERENVRIRNLELQLSIQGWKASNPEKVALESEMVKVLSDPNKKLLVQEGYLSLDDVYSIAKANAPDNSAEIKSQAKQDTLRNLAQKQQAAVPTGNATTTTTSTNEKPFAELSLSEMEKRLGFSAR